jgi:hypothetical protein
VGHYGYWRAPDRVGDKCGRRRVKRHRAVCQKRTEKAPNGELSRREEGEEREGKREGSGRELTTQRKEDEEREGKNGEN